MKISQINAINGYGISRSQQEALYARAVEEVDVQMRIAKSSNNRLVLLNLAMNKSLDEKVVQELFSRGLPYLTNRLNNLGYEKDWLNIF